MKKTWVKKLVGILQESALGMGVAIFAHPLRACFFEYEKEAAGSGI
jgi:hypothetical protein